MVPAPTKELDTPRASYPVVRRAGATLEEVESVYRARVAVFRRVAAAIVGDRERARDAVQEAFALAVRERGSFRGDAPLEAWLWRIVLNAAATEQRRAVRELPAGDLEGRRNGHAERADDEIRRALGRLPERQRLVLFLRYYADLDYRTIAEAAEITAGTVGATLNAAHAAMRRLLEEASR